MLGSVVHLLDGLHHQLRMIFSQFVLSGELEPVYTAFGGVEWSFIVRRLPLDWSKVQDLTSYKGACTGEQTACPWLVAMHAAIDRIASQQAVPPALVGKEHTLVDCIWARGLGVNTCRAGFFAPASGEGGGVVRG